MGETHTHQDFCLLRLSQLLCLKLPFFSGSQLHIAYRHKDGCVIAPYESIAIDVVDWD
jgi:hypothetical protein